MSSHLALWSGASIDLRHPDPDRLALMDVAHHLGRQPVRGGVTRRVVWAAQFVAMLCDLTRRASTLLIEGDAHGKEALTLLGLVSYEGIAFHGYPVIDDRAVEMLQWWRPIAGARLARYGVAWPPPLSFLELVAECAELVEEAITEQFAGAKLKDPELSCPVRINALSRREARKAYIRVFYTLDNRVRKPTEGWLRDRDDARLYLEQNESRTFDPWGAPIGAEFIAPAHKAERAALDSWLMRRLSGATAMAGAVS